MKIFFQHILSMGILVIALLFTADSALGQGDMYEETEYSLYDAPLLASSLQRIAEGEQPYLVKVAADVFLGDGTGAEEASLENTEVTSGVAQISDGNGMNESDGDLAQNDPVSTEGNGEAEENSALSSGDANASGEVSGQEAALDGASEEANPEGESNEGTNPDEASGESNPEEIANDAANPEEASNGDVNSEGAANEASNPENAENTVPSAENGEEVTNEGDQSNEQNVPVDAATEEPVSEQVSDNYVLSRVPDEYFDDALFIGDSRTVGLSEYCPELDSRATFYSKVSLTIYGLDDKKFVSVPVIPEEGTDIPEDQLPKEKVTVLEALSRKQFSKIYIMLGLNELGSGTAGSFTEAYGNVINQIRELQPDAIIIIQGIMHVTHSKSSSDRVFKNSTINERNEVLKTLADGQHVFYVDMNEATDDENGGLGQDLSFDNVHLKAKSYALWYDYLKNHAYVKESQVEYYNQILEETENGQTDGL